MTAPIRSLCIVAPTAYPVLATSDVETAGGAEVQLMLLGKAFRERGIEVTVLVSGTASGKVEEVEGLRIVPVPFRYFGGTNLFYPVDTATLVTTLGELSPDVVLMKTPRSLLFGLSIHRRMHGGLLVRIVSYDSDCQWHATPPTNLLYHAGSLLADGHVFQTRTQQEMALANLGLEGRVIANIAHRAPTNRRRRKRDLDALWVGTCAARKDPESFLDLATRMTDIRFGMVVAPGEDDRLNERVRKRARSLANVRDFGFVPYRRIFNIYQRARLLVNTSRAEGFPNVFLQAWQCGTPVVTRHIDPDGVVAQHELGRVSGSSLQQEADIRELLQDHELRVRLGRRGFAYVEQNHAPEAVVSRYLDYFTALREAQ